MSTPSTIHELLQAGDDDSISISGIDRPDLSYSELRDLTARTAETLNALGIGRNDRVAIVLPNGPEMATAFVTIASCATTAPLNPAYTQEEYEFYLSDLNARALLVEKNSDSPAVRAAQAQNIQLLELETQAGLPAGMFSIHSAENGAYAQNESVGVAGPGRYRADSAHVGNHVEAEDCAAQSYQPLCLGQQHPAYAAPGTRRCLPECHAAVSYTRADGCRPRNARQGRQRLLLTWIRCTQIFLVAGSGESNLVHRRPHDATDNLAEGETQSVGSGSMQIALHPVFIVVVAIAGVSRTGEDVRSAGDRGICNDRSGASNDLQSIATGSP